MADGGRRIRRPRSLSGEPPEGEVLGPRRLVRHGGRGLGAGRPRSARGRGAALQPHRCVVALGDAARTTVASRWCRGPRLLRRSASEPSGRPHGHDGVGPSRHAVGCLVGRGLPLGDRPARRHQMGPAPAGRIVDAWPAVRTNRSGQPAWRQTGACTSSRTGRAGGSPTCTAARTTVERRDPLTEEPAEFHGPDWVLGQTTMVELARRLPPGSPDLERPRCPGAHHRPAAPPTARRAAVRVHLDRVPARRRRGLHRGPGRRARRRVGAGAHRTRTARPLRPGRAPIAGAGRRLGGASPSRWWGARADRSTGSCTRRRWSGTAGPAGALPPLVVSCHGGPTASAGAGFDVTMQYFTSRGFAVARGRLRREHGLRAGLSLLALGAVGGGRRRGLRRRGPPPGGTGTGWTAPAWPSGAGVPAASPRSTPWLPVRGSPPPWPSTG